MCIVFAREVLRRSRKWLWSNKSLLDNFSNFLYPSVCNCVTLHNEQQKENSKMLANELGQQLHDRATRGGVLSADERAQLEAWYDEMDHAEMARLNLAARTKNFDFLQAEIDAAQAQILVTVKRIQKTEKENDALRREITALEDLLAQKNAL